MEENKEQKEEMKFPFTYRIFKEALGDRFQPNSFNLIIAPVKSGKDTLLQNLCTQVLDTGYNAIYLSSDTDTPFIKRNIMSNLLDLPLDKLEILQRDNTVMNGRMREFELLHAHTVGRIATQNIANFENIEEVLNSVTSVNFHKNAECHYLFMDGIDLISRDLYDTLQMIKAFQRFNNYVVFATCNKESYENIRLKISSLPDTIFNCELDRSKSPYILTVNCLKTRYAAESINPESFILNSNRARLISID